MTEGRPLVVERTYAVSSAAMQAALTEPDRIRQWSFAMEEKQYLHRCRVTAVDALRLFAYTLRYEGYAGDTLVTWELDADGTSMRLRLTHTGVETFPGDVPDFARENFVAGWNALPGTSLPEYFSRT
jgi:hypothetical protein